MCVHVVGPCLHPLTGFLYKQLDCNTIIYISQLGNKRKLKDQDQIVREALVCQIAKSVFDPDRVYTRRFCIHELITRAVPSCHATAL